MPTTEPMILNRQCLAAAVLFARVSLARQREADAIPHTPEAAVLRRRAQLYSDLGADMTRLAVELAEQGGAK